MATLASMATGSQVVTHDANINVFTVDGGGTTAAFVIDSIPDNHIGSTLQFRNGAYPQFNCTGTFGDSSNLYRTTIVETSTAGQPGRTAYNNAGRFLGTSSTALRFVNVDWMVDSATANNDDSAKESGFHLSRGSSVVNFQHIILDGVNVEGYFLDNQWVNPNVQVVNNASRGFGFRMWMKSSNNLVPFTIGLQTTLTHEPDGIVLLRGATTPAAGNLQFNAWDLAANSSLSLRNLNVEGVGILAQSANRAGTIVNLIDPVNNTMKLGSPYSGASLTWGQVRMFRTRKFVCAGVNASSTTLRLDNTTSGAPSWAEPNNATIGSDNSVSVELAVKHSAHATIAETLVNSYSYCLVGYNFRRLDSTFAMNNSVSTPDIALSLTADTLGDGSAITAFVQADDNLADDLDKLYRAVKTHEVTDPDSCEDIRIYNDDGVYKLRTASDGNVVLSFRDDSDDYQFLFRTNSRLWIYNFGDDDSIGTGTAKGLDVNSISLGSRPDSLLQFPYKTGSTTQRKLTLTGPALWSCGMFARSSGNTIAVNRLLVSPNGLTISGFVSGNETVLAAGTREGYNPVIANLVITDDSELSLSMELQAAPEDTLAIDGSSKFDVTEVGNAGSASFTVTAPDGPHNCKLRLQDRIVSVKALYSMQQRNLTLETGIKWLAFGGIPTTYEKFGIVGDVVIMPGSTQYIRESSGNGNAGVDATTYQSNNQPVDDSLGSVTIVGGVRIVEMEQQILNADVDPDEEGTQTLASRINAIKDGIDTVVPGVNNLSTELASVKSTAEALPGAAAIVNAVFAKTIDNLDYEDLMLLMSCVLTGRMTETESGEQRIVRFFDNSGTLRLTGTTQGNDRVSVTRTVA